MTPTLMLEERLKLKFPGRDHQIKQLLHYLDYEQEGGHHLSSSLYIYGHSATGKTSLIKDILREFQLITHNGKLRWAFINCIECSTQRLLFHRVLYQWFDIDVRCDHLTEFMDFIKEHSGQEQSSFILVRK